MCAEIQDESTSKPPFLWRVAHFAEAVAVFIADGCQTVTVEQYAERLQICQTCPLQRFGECLICGCNLRAKARMRSEKCPRYEPLWPDLTLQG